jgi:hypothetical protein
MMMQAFATESGRFGSTDRAVAGDPEAFRE